MAYISLPEGLPGIRGAMAFRPETAKPLNELVEVLLRGHGGELMHMDKAYNFSLDRAAFALASDALA